jgi:RHS repeat-associated protein
LLSRDGGSSRARRPERPGRKEHSTGTTAIEYIFAEGQLLAQVDSSGNLFYVHNNQIGAPQKMTNSSMTIVFDREQEPFGEDYATPTNTTPTQHRFPGQYADAEDLLSQNNNREYDPTIGYIEADPIGLAGGLNPRAYAGNNPTQAIDPWGLAPPLGNGVPQLSYVAAVSPENPSSGSDPDVAGTPSVAAPALPPAPSPASPTSPQAAADQPCAPSQFGIINPDGENHGTYSNYYYQLEDANGNALTGDDYSAAEYMSPDTGDTSTGKFPPLVNGVFIDQVGWTSAADVPKGNYDAVRLQTFTVRYQGTTYPLSTVFRHENSVVNGVVTNSVTDVTGTQ